MRCHASFQYICVMPLSCDKNHSLNLTKNHLLGIWKDNDMAQLHTYISAMEQST